MLWIQKDQPEAYARAVEDLRQLIPGLRGFRTRSIRSKDRPYQVLALMQHEDLVYELGLEELSFGQRCLVALYACARVAEQRSALLLLDEPDNHVALQEIQPFLYLLDDLIMDGGCQVILVSHHPAFIDRRAPDEGTLFFRPAGGSTVVRRFRSELPFTASQVLVRQEAS